MNRLAKPTTLLVMLLGGTVICFAGRPATRPTTPTSRRATTRSAAQIAAANEFWQTTLHKGLRLYYEGKYQEVFDLIDKAVHSAEPGRNVHRCVALMRRAFIGIHKQEEPVRSWNPSAEKHLKQLESKKSLSDPDLVIVACLRDVYVRAPTAEPTKVPILDKLIDPARNSRWRDWAYWQKARVIASKAWTWTGDLGTVVFRLAEKRRIGCLADRYTSSLTIRGRAAEAFLKKHPQSHMADVMRLELVEWRWRKAAVAVRELVNNRWYTGEGDLEGFPLNKKQLELLTQAEANVIAAGKLFPKVFLEVFVAEDKLDHILWVSGSTRDIPEYFRTILKVKGKQALSAEIRQWLATIPIPEGRKAESRPRTRETQ